MRSRILNWVLLVGLAIAGIWGYNQYNTRIKYETLINNQNQRSFYDLVGNFENMSTLTSKSLVSTSPQNKASLLSDIWWQANNAQQNLAEIPFDGQAVRRTTKFLTQIGDFSYALSKKSAKGLPISNAEINKMQELHNQIGFLSGELQRLNERVGQNGLAYKDFQIMSKKTDKTTAGMISNTFTRLDKQMQQYPTLIYDGPFSDHIQQKKPVGVAGKVYTVAEAKTQAMNFIDKLPKRTYTIKSMGMAKGKIPAYSMMIKSKDGTEVTYLDVARQGGSIIYFLNTRPIKMRRMDSTQARVYAQTFLQRNGYSPMASSYSYRQGNVAVITFAYKDGEVIVYPDLVKVKVALDNGQVVGFEGLNYLMNHQKRNLPKPEKTVSELRAKIPTHLQILSEKLTLIPTETLTEKLCYEFRVKFRGDTFLIYLNAISGDEEKILKVIDLPNGQFTM